MNRTRTERKSIMCVVLYDCPRDGRVSKELLLTPIIRSDQSVPSVTKMHMERRFEAISNG